MEKKKRHKWKIIMITGKWWWDWEQYTAPRRKWWASSTRCVFCPSLIFTLWKDDPKQLTKDALPFHNPGPAAPDPVPSSRLLPSRVSLSKRHILLPLLWSFATQHFFAYQNHHMPTTCDHKTTRSFNPLIISIYHYVLFFFFFTVCTKNLLPD